jgi:hypothetical protein
MSPYWLRFLQCSRRIADTQKEFPSIWKNPNLWNAIKYLSGLAVPVVSSLYPPSPLIPFPPQVVTAGLIATIYMITWDTKMDWGMNFVGQSPQRSRLYPKWMYTYIFVTNAAFRFGWVLTLLPVMWLGCNWDDKTDAGAACDVLPSKDFIIFVASLIEIIRRAQWSLLRCEHEHLTNNSRFRAFCWIPPLVTQDAESPSFRRRGTLRQYSGPLGASLLGDDKLKQPTVKPKSDLKVIKKEANKGSISSGTLTSRVLVAPTSNGNTCVTVSSQMWPGVIISNTNEDPEVQKEMQPEASVLGEPSATFSSEVDFKETTVGESNVFISSKVDAKDLSGESNSTQHLSGSDLETEIQGSERRMDQA